MTETIDDALTGGRGHAGRGRRRAAPAAVAPGRGVSGLYQARRTLPRRPGRPGVRRARRPPRPPRPRSSRAAHLGFSGELRLDVDGRYPQMVASGTLRSGLFIRIHWIARVNRVGPRTWAGSVFYRDGSGPASAYTDVRVTVVRPALQSPPTAATVRFTGGGTSGMTMAYRYRSPFAHEVELEYDAATGVSPVTSFDVGSHPNRPATITAETISIEDVYRRAGFRVTRSNGDSVVPLGGAGADALWSDAECTTPCRPTGAASPTCRSGRCGRSSPPCPTRAPASAGSCSTTSGPTTGRAPPSSTTRSSPSRRPATPTPTRPWPASGSGPRSTSSATRSTWPTRGRSRSASAAVGPGCPLVDQPEARSFMNYPYRVSGGVSAFFADFAYRFTDDELLFLRHAPERFVQQGNAAWFDNHGFEQANISPEPQLALELRVHRDDWHGVPTFGFLEPVYVELKLSNVGPSPVVVDEHILLDRSAMVVVVKREGRDATMRMPYASFCNSRVAAIAGPRRGALREHAGLGDPGGFMIDEPGRYVVQMALELPSGEHLVSNRLQLRGGAPQADGARAAGRRLPHRRRGPHLRVRRAVSSTRPTTRSRRSWPACRTSRSPGTPTSCSAGPRPRRTSCSTCPAGRPAPSPSTSSGARISVKKAEPKVAEEHLHAALDDAPVAAETLGHIRFNRAVDRFATVLEDQGEHAVAAAVVGQAQRAAQRPRGPRFGGRRPGRAEAASRGRGREARPCRRDRRRRSARRVRARPQGARHVAAALNSGERRADPRGDRPGAATGLVLSDPRMVSVNCRSSRPGIPAAYRFRGRHPRGRGDRAVPTVRQPEPRRRRLHPHASAPDPARRAVHRARPRRPGHADRSAPRPRSATACSSSATTTSATRSSAGPTPAATPTGSRCWPSSARRPSTSCSAACTSWPSRPTSSPPTTRR